MRNRLQRRSLIFAIFIVLACIALSLFLSWLIGRYPMTDGTKDWLDILSALGQAAGVVVLVGLVTELYRQRTEMIKRQTPDIQISAEIVEMNTLPTTGYLSLTETVQPFLHIHPADGSYDADYVNAWNALNHQNVSHFIRILIENRGVDRESYAKDFKVQVELTMGLDAREMTFLQPNIFWCPASGIEIPNAGGQKYIFVKCAPSSIPGITYVTGKILDYKCVNLNGNSVKGKKHRFTPITITGRSIV